MTVEASLLAGPRDGDDADWWVLMRTPSPGRLKWFHYDFEQGWRPGFGLSRQAPCEDFGPEEIMATNSLPSGRYALYFLIDLNADGRIDKEDLYYDVFSLSISR